MVAKTPSEQLSQLLSDGSDSEEAPFMEQLDAEDLMQEAADQDNTHFPQEEHSLDLRQWMPNDAPTDANPDQYLEHFDLTGIHKG